MIIVSIMRMCEYSWVLSRQHVVGKYETQPPLSELVSNSRGPWGEEEQIRKDLLSGRVPPPTQPQGRIMHDMGVRGEKCLDRSQESCQHPDHNPDSSQLTFS